MDEIDRQVIELLRRGSRMPYVAIARKVGLTEGAVRARVNRLTREKVIRKFTIEVEEDIKGIVFITTFPAVPTAAIASRIRGMGIERVYEVSGMYDILCFLSEESVKTMNATVERIRRMRGVKETNTMLILK